jgi:hypothetical protein
LNCTIKILSAATQSKKMMKRDCDRVYKNNAVFKDFVKL